MATILITNNFNKKRKIKEIRETTPFKQIKFYSINELLNIYPYQYTNKTLEFICEEENVILDVAKIYLSTLTLYPVENLPTEKGIFLSNLKKKLLEKNLLTYNILLKEKLEKSQIQIENLYPSTTLKKIFNEFPNIEFIEEEKKNFIPQIYECQNIDEEITIIGEMICELINQGVNINQIYLKNITDEYIPSLKRIFKLLKIPLALKERTTLLEIPLVTKFLHLYEQEETLGIDYLNEQKKFPENQEIIKMIIETLNKYTDLKSKKMFIKKELSTKTKKEILKENAIHELNLKEEVNEEDYIFILGFNNNIPKTFKDEEYLTDKEKKYLGFSTAEEKNLEEKETLLKIMYGNKNTFITYKKEQNGKPCYPSPLLENGKIITNKQPTYTYSNEYNKLELASLLDDYNKYSTITPTLLKLNNSYSLPYQTYDEQFRKIPPQKIFDFIKNKLTLSYTSLDTFNKCSFAFFLNNIIKISPKEENFNLKLGNLYHKVLEQIHEEEFDFDYIYEHEIKENEWTCKELFFLKKLKEELRFVINTIKEQETFSSLTEIKTEVPIEIKIPSNLDITFKGKIDKLSYKKVNNQTVINITDYKTGSTAILPSYYPIGLNLQLPIYLYLATKIPNLENIVIGGFYLQKIILPKIKQNPEKNYEAEKKECLKLQGYSNPNKEILGLVDNSFSSSKIIAGLKEKKDGNFYQTSKILDEETLSTMKELIEKNINNCLKNIEEGNFLINPKIVDNKENASCPFCPYQDICFHSPKYNVYINTVKDFLKKEVPNGLDE